MATLIFVGSFGSVVDVASEPTCIRVKVALYSVI